jgi:hypothetical protein
MRLVPVGLGGLLVSLVLAAPGATPAPESSPAQEMVASELQARLSGSFDGLATFRFDTFGDEQLWTDVLRMHEVVQTLPPSAALGVGLKVDVEALPPAIVAALAAGQVDLEDPAVTLELLRLDAVVGV